MLISEITKKGSEELIRESDEYLLKSVLDSLILNIKSRLEHKQGVYTLDQVMAELNRQTGSVYIDPTNEDRRNMIIQAFEKQGMDIERGSGKITLGAAADVDTEDPGEVEKQNKSAEIAGKAMDKIKGKSTDAETIDGDL